MGVLVSSNFSDLKRQLGQKQLAGVSKGGDSALTTSPLSSYEAPWVSGAPTARNLSKGKQNIDVDASEATVTGVGSNVRGRRK